MSRKFEYVVVQLADRTRGEQLNAALAIFSDSNLDIKIPRRLEKLRALSAALDIESVRITIEQLRHFDGLLRSQGYSSAKDRIAGLSKLSSLQFSSPSDFIAPSVGEYEELSDRLLKLLIEPEPARSKPMHKRTRLISSVKSAFRSRRVLAKKGEDMSNHRIVADVKIAEGLSADFVLKNGAMHVIETVDASNDDLSTRKIVSDIAVSALVLEQARMLYGEKKTTSRLVYDASSAMEKLAMPSLHAAAHQGAQLINWASTEDQKKLLAELALLANPYEEEHPNKASATYATTQHKLNLN